MPFRFGLRRKVHSVPAECTLHACRPERRFLLRLHLPDGSPDVGKQSPILLRRGLFNEPRQVMKRLLPIAGFLVENTQIEYGLQVGRMMTGRMTGQP